MTDPLEIYRKLEARNRTWARAFVGLFNGGKRRGRVTPKGGLFLGKCECEPEDWRECYTHMRDIGLVEFRTEKEPNHPGIGGETEYAYIQPTKLGLAAREADLREWRIWAARSND